jgi:hypothetical protein
MDGVMLRISPLSYDEAQVYIEESIKLVQQDPKPTRQEWEFRTLDAVVLALNKALNGQGQQWDRARLTKELDIQMITYLYDQFVEMSALRPVPMGEVAATPSTTSTSS